MKQRHAELAHLAHNECAVCMCHNLELLQSNLICLPVALVSIVEGVLTQFFLNNILFDSEYFYQYMVQVRGPVAQPDSGAQGHL